MESLVHGMVSNAAAVAILAALVAIAARVVRRPALVHSVCLLALLKLVTPPVLPVPIGVPWTTPEPAPAVPVAEAPTLEVADVDPDNFGPWPDPVPEDIEALALAEEPQEQVTEAVLPAAFPVASWEGPALVLMLAGALAWWTLAALRIVRFHRALAGAEPMPAVWQREVVAMAARFGLRRPPMAYLVPGDVPPMLWAFGWRARLLVPGRLWGSLGEEERSALLLHELAHLKRRDHWVRWAELAIAGVYWWNPAVWWLRRALREAEEQCCDAWVVWAMPRGARTYAAALVAALEFVSGSRTAPAAAASATLGNGHVSCMKRRLRMIVKARTPRGLSWPGRLAVACVSALLLPLAPSWAQKGSDDGGGKPHDAPAAAPEQGVPDAQSAKIADELFDADMKLLDARAELEATREMLEEVKRVEIHDLESRIGEEFTKDPDARSVIERVQEAQKSVEEAQRKTRHNSDPAVAAARRQHAKLKAEHEELWSRKHDEIAARLRREQQPESKALAEKVGELQRAINKYERKKARLAELTEELKAGKRVPSARVVNPTRRLEIEIQTGKGEPRKVRKPDDGDKTRKDAQAREPAGRAESELRTLKEKLARDLDPLSDVVRKELERSLDDLQRVLKKEGTTPEDMRRALEKSRNELRESLRRGGPLEESIREVAERARQDMREAMERSLKDAEAPRAAMAARLREMREAQRKQAEELTEQQRRRMEQQRKAVEDFHTQVRREAEQSREQARAARPERKEARSRPERPGAEEKEADDTKKLDRPGSERGDLDRAPARREAAQARAARPERKEARSRLERPRAEARKPDEPKKPEDARKSDRPEPDRGELDAARKEISDLRLRLLEANQRLQQLERREREARRSATPGRPGPAAKPATPAAKPATPAAKPAAPAAKPAAPAAKPAAPAAKPAAPAAKPAAPAPRPGQPDRPAPAAKPAPAAAPAPKRDEYERRFRDLNDKMDRMLKELEDLKHRGSPAAPRA